MNNISLTIQELSDLLKITAGLADNPVGEGCLSNILCSLRKIVPFTRCVLLHERTSVDGLNTFRHEFIDAGDCSLQPHYIGRENSSIEQYLAQHNREDVLQHAFYWTPAPLTCNRGTVNTATLPAAGRGIGASISHQPRNAERGTTALLLQCDDAAFVERHLAMIDVVVGHLHLNLLNDPAFADDTPSFTDLTSKESKVMQWAIKGKTSWEIGKILSISERTVKFHLANIYTKFNVTNRVQAVSVATSGRMNFPGSASGTGKEAGLMTKS